MKEENTLKYNVNSHHFEFGKNEIHEASIGTWIEEDNDSLPTVDELP